MTSGTDSLPILDVRGLSVEFRVGRPYRTLRAVDGVDLTVSAGETVGLVGESGSGKTTLTRAILGLTPITSGAVIFDGTDITHASYRERRRLSNDMQAVFQDPYSSLNPTRTIGQSLGETLRVHGHRPRREIDQAVGAMLKMVGLDSDDASRYPHQFSGGQRQRIAIARALMVQPRLVICDEPLSALDLSVQAQILNLLRGLQKELCISSLFVSHDLAVIRHISHRIVVLFHGQVMEQGDAITVCTEPAHPYTRALLAAAPVPDPDRQRQRRDHRLPSAAVQAGQQTLGCPFADRCPHVIDICRAVRPELEPIPSHSAVACHRWKEIRHRAPREPGRPQTTPTADPPAGSADCSSTVQRP